MNQINVIRPYLYGSSWVFDDEVMGANKEALVGGTPALIAAACAAYNVPNPQDGFTVLFSKDYFPDSQFVLDLVETSPGGSTFYSKDFDISIWLCPFLFKYFPTAPEKMYIQVAP